MSTEIIESVCKADNLPSLPTVAVEILRLAKQDNTSADDLAAVIQNDPALTGKMLKMVNSSMFGIPREITDKTTQRLSIQLRQEIGNEIS